MNQVRVLELVETPLEAVRDLEMLGVLKGIVGVEDSALRRPSCILEVAVIKVRGRELLGRSLLFLYLNFAYVTFLDN